jgi:hypothetical protein
MTDFGCMYAIRPIVWNRISSHVTVATHAGRRFSKPRHASSIALQTVKQLIDNVRCGRFGQPPRLVIEKPKGLCLIQSDPTPIILKTHIELFKPIGEPTRRMVVVFQGSLNETLHCFYVEKLFNQDCTSLKMCPVFPGALGQMTATKWTCLFLCSVPLNT